MFWNKSEKPAGKVPWFPGGLPGLAGDIYMLRHTMLKLSDSSLLLSQHLPEHTDEPVEFEDFTINDRHKF
ncbi:hypothetical protein GCM10011379_53700 [Filimonas zeae]|uniref:Uncharacterized protein n=1 Tax=Filimonas zeae TaxID=1737353 RepID=A0A917J6K7_9BACT|nr:hypothetical protein GCM10011379_53700 [Filimonas zeae]